MSNNLLEARGVNKTFGLTVALSNVDIDIGRGEIQGLIGENGSGKSTFSSICAGIQGADSGKIILDSEEYKPGSTIDAMNCGVSMVVQEQGTVSQITVASNIFLGKEKDFTKYGVLHKRIMEREAQKALDEIGAGHIAAGDMIDRYTFEDRKLIELARSLNSNPKLWIIDETTTALTVSGREILFSLMNKMRSQGNSVLFISHDIDEIIKMCDCLTVLRDGAFVGKIQKKDFSPDTIKQMMIGREMSGHYYREDDREDFSHEVSLKVENLSVGMLKKISFDLHKGEILGVGGLSDCGMHELGKAAFGLIKPDEGSVTIKGEKRVKNASMAVKNGVAYVSKNRDKESMMLICSIKDNVCLPSLDNIKTAGLISKKREESLASKWMKELSVKADNSSVYCSTLSGGNKQKVVLAKWLAKNSDILILDCPTRGIDVGTKSSIYSLIESLKKQGKSVLLISEELSEIIGMSDRLLVLKDGEITGEFKRSEGITESKLIEKMI